LVISNLESDDQNTLTSDVIQMVTSPDPCTTTSPCPSVVNDMATVQLTLVLRDPGSVASPNSPSLLNQVTVQPLSREVPPR
jgi:hypothetical protein